LERHATITGAMVLCNIILADGMALWKPEYPNASNKKHKMLSYRIGKWLTGKCVALPTKC